MTSRYDDLASRFRALAHPVRLQIVDMLLGGEACVCHMEAALDKRQAYISQQMIVLREAGLVKARKDGLQVFYRLVDPTLEDLLTATLGSEIVTQYPPIDGCPCPHCEHSRSPEGLKAENDFERISR